MPRIQRVVELIRIDLFFAFRRVTARADPQDWSDRDLAWRVQVSCSSASTVHLQAWSGEIEKMAFQRMRTTRVSVFQGDF